MKRWITIIGGLLISALALYLAFRQTDFAGVLAAVERVKPGWAIAACATIALSAFVRGVRWNILLEGRLKVVDAFWLWVVGFLFNNVLPLKLGEIARALLAGRRPGNSFGASLSSVVVERLFDMVAVALLLGIALVGLPLPGWAKQAGAVMGVGAVSALAALAGVARYPQGALNLGVKILGVIPTLGQERVRAFLSPLVEGLGGVASWRTFAAGFGMTVVSWAMSALAMGVMMMAFWPVVPPIVAVLAVGAAGLGVSVPSAPSGVGPYEAAVIAVLTAISYDRSTTQAFAVVMHAAMFAVTSVLGLIGLLREGVSFGQIAREAQEVRTHAAEVEAAS